MSELSSCFSLGEPVLRHIGVVFFFLPIMSRSMLSIHDARSLHCRYPARVRRGWLEPMWTSSSCSHPRYMRPYCHHRADEALSNNAHPRRPIIICRRRMSLHRPAGVRRGSTEQLQMSPSHPRSRRSHRSHREHR